MKKLSIILIILMLVTSAYAGNFGFYATDVTQSGDNTFTGSNIFNSGLTSEAELKMEDNAITNVGYMDFNLANGVPQAEGRQVWNDNDGTANLGLKGGVVNLQIV